MRLERLGLGQHRPVAPADLPRILTLARRILGSAGEVRNADQRFASYSSGT